MTIGQVFLKEVEAELNASRPLLERVPNDKVRWKPHQKSAALGHLTQLVCRMPKVMSDIVKGIDLDLAAGPGYSFETTEVLLREFDANVAEVRATLTTARDADFDGTWNVRAGGDIYDTSGRMDALRNTINHFVHHRGQLTVYLRLLDVPIPQLLYGPTADEK
ncbi:MAG: damage-inducible protein DinB [Gemmatimonadaceae bacterium]|nr:damage-inducible protein DinB [Gemmatimonadaceae bacterium]